MSVAPIEPELQAEVRPLLDGCGDKRILIWGAGPHGLWITEQLGPRVVGFVDSNPTKQGTLILGRPVFMPDELGALDFDQV